MDLIRSLSWISASHLRLVRDDDSHVDRLSHRYTVAICVLFAIIVSTKQYAGDPIDCWVPAQFKASYEKYADSYCWIAGSWYTPMDKELPLSERERRSHRIRYYQWVPFLLLFQAILCYVPRIIWRTLNVRSGLDIVNLVDAAIKYESVDKFNDREKIMAYIIKNIERYIGARKSRYERLYGRQLCSAHKNYPRSPGGVGGKSLNEPGSGTLDGKQPFNKNMRQIGQRQGGAHPSKAAVCCHKCWLRLRIVLSTVCFWTGKRLGNYLVVLYMFVKTLWLTNAVSQLFLLNRFIGNDYHAFGIEIIEMLLSGQEWHELRHFPRVTYCDFKIREIGNQHDWTVQCVLRINLFNEVIYIFMWFWLCILAMFSCVDYLTWTFRLLIPSDKLRFIKRHLDIYNFYHPGNQSPRQHGSSPMKFASNDMQGQTPGPSGLDDAGKQQQQLPQQPDFEYVDIEKEKKLMKEFTFAYLKDDGIFAMRIMASSASDLIVTEIISELWKNFKANYVEPASDESTIIISPSSSSASSSSSSSSSRPSSAATSPTSSPTAPAPVLQLSALKNSHSSHSNNTGSPANNQSTNASSGGANSTFVKRPFNYQQQLHSQHKHQHQPQQQPPYQYQAPTSIYSTANPHLKSAEKARASPPVPASSGPTYASPNLASAGSNLYSAGPSAPPPSSPPPPVPSHSSHPNPSNSFDETASLIRRASPPLPPPPAQSALHQQSSSAGGAQQQQQQHPRHIHLPDHANPNSKDTHV